MSDSISFKAYLKRDGQEVEVRRFAIDGGAATNYMYLRGKIEAMFPSVQTDQFDIYWQDNDKDYIIISTDEELVEALTACAVPPLKVYIQVRASQPSGGGGSSPLTHAGVTCDGCEGPVTGYRYKCVTCPDYDLCATCERAGLHPDHFMLRMPSALVGLGQNKMFRKFFARPHKFHKRHSWGRMADMCMEGRGPMGSGPCPSSRRERPAQAMAGMTDMFDFSALLEFINSLGVTTAAGARREANEMSATTQAASSSQSQPSQAAGPQEPPQGPSTPGQSQARASQPQPTEYLNGIGHAIAAFLDPFGIDVTFDVRSKPPGSQEEAAPTGQNTSTAPATSPEKSPAPTPSAEKSPAVEVPAQSPGAPTEAVSATAVSATDAIPLPPPGHASSPARRNSDDWTLLNRESPTRSDVVAMDVDEARGAKPKSPTIYPELPKDTPSAPAPADSVPLSGDRQRIQEAIDSIRAMGFNFETALLRELLRRENCDIASVLETILTNSGKK